MMPPRMENWPGASTCQFFSYPIRESCSASSVSSTVLSISIWMTASAISSNGTCGLISAAKVVTTVTGLPSISFRSTFIRSATS